MDRRPPGGGGAKGPKGGKDAGKGGPGGKDRGGKDAGKGGPKGGGKGDGKDGKDRGPLRDRRRYVFKALCSDSLAANIIGHAGQTRKNIEEESGCSVWISKRDEFFPQTQCRILLLHADNPSQVMSAIEHTISRLADVAEQEGHESAETPLLGKEGGEYIYRMALPSFVRGKLIGSGGSNIRKLREDTGAKIFVENEVYNGHQLARVIGPSQVIISTLAIINDILQEEVEAPEYEPWAAVQWFSPSAAPDAGKGGHKDKDSRREGPAGAARSPPRGGKGGYDKGGHDRGGHDRGGGGPSQLSGPDRDRRARSRSHGRRRSPERPEPIPEPYDPPEGSPVEVLEGLLGRFPPGAVDMDHAVSCDLPKAAVSALLGEREEYKAHVERSTGTTITVDKSPGPEHLTIMITGPLMWVYAAHCMVMTRYHELEQEKESRRRGGGVAEGTSRVEELQAQLAQLQNQLAEVQRTKGGGGAKGGGGRR